jgi:hypothetical protein
VTFLPLISSQPSQSFPPLPTAQKPATGCWPCMTLCLWKDQRHLRKRLKWQSLGDVFNRSPQVSCLGRKKKKRIFLSALSSSFSNNIFQQKHLPGYPFWCIQDHKFQIVFTPPMIEKANRANVISLLFKDIALKGWHSLYLALQWFCSSHYCTEAPANCWNVTAQIASKCPFCKH